MNTAQRLEGMTDEGEFELLANAILAKSSPLYKSLIQLGVNAEGKTIPSPVDGFCRVPQSDPPHFVILQHTTTSRGNLRRKWMSESGKDPGDLVKAAQRAEALRRDFPSASFTVVLSTNQRLPLKLAEDVSRAEQRLGVGVDIWEQSRYVRFLDTDRDGQYLRWCYLHTDAQMLSLDLLAELSRKSLDAYANEQFTSPDTWIHRNFADEVLRLKSSDRQLAVVMGESGYGKSVVAYQALAEHIRSGGVGLWVSAKIADDCLTLEEALANVLRKLCPSLLPEEARRLPSLIPTGDQILVVVDDVRTVSAPQDLIRRATRWAARPYLTVMPTWPRFWSLAMPGSVPPSAKVIQLERMTLSESVEAVEGAAQRAGRAISTLEARDIANLLGGDPWCIGVWSQKLEQDPGADLHGRAAESVGAYVDDCLQKMEREEKGLLAGEYREALTQLAVCMLQERRLDPRWNDIKTWLASHRDHLDAIRALCRNEKLCRLDSDSRFGFRHDRILEHFAVEALCHTLRSEHSESRELLFDPYYSWWTAEALLRVQQSDEFITEMLGRLPVAVTLTIRHIGIPRTAYERMIVDKVREWVEPLRRSSRIPESVRGAIANSFVFADSPAVLDIVTHDFGLEVHWLGDFARFRNGDAEAGARYAAMAGIGGGKEGSWELLVEHARRRHHDRLAKDLVQMLLSPKDERQMKGALVLAGFLALPELHGGLSRCWELIPDKKNRLLETLWAAIHCTSDSDDYERDTLLARLASYWAELRDVEEADRGNWRQHVASRLGSVLGRVATPSLVAWLVRQAQIYASLQDQVAYLCGLIDLPDAVEHAVRHWAANQGDPHTRSVEYHWGHFDHPRLSAPSVERLRALWESPDNSKPLKELAFSLWLQNVDRERAEILRILSEVDEAEPFFTEAITERARLGDRECVPFLVELLQGNSWLFRVAHHVWCASIRDVASRYLAAFANTIPSDFSGGKLNDHYALSELLMRIPVTDAETLLLENWTHLRCSPLFVQSALFVGTPTCVSMAHKAIEAFPEEVDPLQHIDFHFGFGWGRLPNRPPLTLERLELVGPYLGRLEETALWGYSEACCQYGSEGRAWCEEHVPAELWHRYRKQHFPTDEDILERLSELTTAHPNTVRMYVDKFVERKEERRLVTLLGTWLRGAGTTSRRRLDVAGIILEMIGTRSDLALLNVPPDPSEGACAAREADEIRESVSFSVRLRSLQ